MSWIIGLGGLLVAALVLILHYRERVAGLRSRFYDEQIAAYRALIRSSDDLVSAAVRFIVDHGGHLDDNARPQLWNAIQFQWGAWVTDVRLHGAFLPASVLEQAVFFNKSVLAVAKPEALTIDPNSRGNVEPSGVLTYARDKLVYEIRRQVGTDRLSAENFRLIGASAAGVEEKPRTGK